MLNVNLLALRALVASIQVADGDPRWACLTKSVIELGAMINLVMNSFTLLLFEKSDGTMRRGIRDGVGDCCGLWL